MMKSRLLFLLVLFLTFGEYLVYSQKMNEVQDSARTFDQEKMDAYKESSDYLMQDFLPVNDKNRFVQWLSKKLQKYFSNVSEDQFVKTIGIIFKVILWAIGLFALSMIVFTLYKANLKAVPRPNMKVDIDFQQLEKKIDTDFQPLIEREIAERRFNVALRLLFLQTIQLLHQQKHILWEKDKTNRDYLRELRNSGLRESFSHLVKFYNFGWFGDYKVEEQEFIEIHQAFNTFKMSVK